MTPKYDDSAWQNAIAYVPPTTPMSADTLGNPWRDRAGEAAAPQLRGQQARDLGAPLCDCAGRLSRSDQRRARRRSDSVSRMGRFSQPTFLTRPTTSRGR